MNGGHDGIFTQLTPPRLPKLDKLDVKLTQVQPPGANATSLKGMDDATWNDARVYQVNVPANAAGRRAILTFHYIGDAVRVYVGDKLFDDNFYNGDPFSIALWRIPADDWDKVQLKVLPYSDGLLKRLPPQALALVDQAKKDSTLDQVTVEAKDQLEIGISPTDKTTP